MVQGMGDDYQAGYSLNQGGWNWGNWFGGSGNPFMDIFAVTMANFRFQNFTGGGSMWNGFMGGGMGGFQMSPFGGAEYNFSTSGSGGSSSTKAPKTSDERIAEQKVKNKHEAMTNLLNEYLKTITDKNSDDYLKLNDILQNDGKPKTQEGYDVLKSYYTEYKDKIKTALLATDDWKKVISVGGGNYFNGKTGGNGDKLVSSDVLDGDSLKSDIDVIELWGDLMTKNNSGWFYKEDGDNDATKKLRSKVNKAIYNALKIKVESLRGSSELSPETKAALEKTLTICSESDQFYADENSKPYKACAAMYFWIRIAQAEILDNKYASLNEDFSGDALLGKDSAVAAVKKDLYETERYSKEGYCAKQNYS